MTAPQPPPLPPRQRPTQPPLPPRPPGPENIHSDSNLSIPHPSGSKRRLLLIYVHGFNGSEASFQQFPAHVHSVLADAVAESHELYTRIYPRYKSRGDMNLARDQFSSWLAPHEAPDLDIILLGHSLGGILTAEVALLSSPGTNTGQKHKILGMINYDVPFLGLHPGIIQTSAKSLFRRDQTPAEFDQAFSETQTQAASFASLQQPSPEHYDPPFFNDVRVPERKGLQGAMHFVEKNYSRLTRSIVSRMYSPYQFAGCLNNYPELRRRYKLLMELEGKHDLGDRVRFVNYYTDSEPASYLDKEAVAEPNTDAEPNTETEAEAEQVKAEKSESETERDTEKKESETQDANGKAEAGTEKKHDTSDAPTHESTDSTNTENTPDLAHQETREAHTEEPEEETKAQAQAQPGPHTLEETQTQPEEEAEPTPPKRRKFILLPSHHWRGYGDDSLWVPINMDNMNEILAHQSIFIPQGRNYDQLVGDTVATIERWVQDALTVQTLDAVRCEEGK